MRTIAQARVRAWAADTGPSRRRSDGRCGGRCDQGWLGYSPGVIEILYTILRLAAWGGPTSTLIDSGNGSTEHRCTGAARESCRCLEHALD